MAPTATRCVAAGVLCVWLQAWAGVVEVQPTTCVCPPAAQAAAEPSLHLRKEASACMVVEQLSPRAPPLT